MANRYHDKWQNAAKRGILRKSLEGGSSLGNDQVVPMQIIESPMQMQEAAVSLRVKGKLIALIPTSGALNAGHAALIEKARESADVIVVSIFVNHLEFGPNEDFERYPRCPDEDEAFCRNASVDILFRPAAKKLYAEGFSFSVSETAISRGLCGVSRPHYFAGVCTFHTILLNLIRPDNIILGMRDAQKTAVLRKLVTELRFPAEVIPVEIVREENGLPCNARNAYLNEFQLNDAMGFYKALQEGKRLAEGGITNVDRILAEVIHHISQCRRLRVIYVSAVNPHDMQPVRANIIPGETMIAAAIWCDQVRLIDNIQL
jgi:pantoate--beta-alanine ligase